MDGVERRSALVERAIRQLRWATRNAGEARSGLHPDDRAAPELERALGFMEIAMDCLISARYRLQGGHHTPKEEP